MRLTVKHSSGVPVKNRLASTWLAEFSTISVCLFRSCRVNKAQYKQVSFQMQYKDNNVLSYFAH